MTIGLAFLLFWILRIFGKVIYIIEEKNGGTSCGSFIMGTIILIISIWFVVRFWNVPF